MRAQNELGVLEFIHALVETLDKYFENVVRAGERDTPATRRRATVTGRARAVRA